MIVGSYVNIDALSFKEGLTALHLATIHKRHECVATLLKLGANIDAQDSKQNCTALHFAVMGEDVRL